MVLEGFGGAAVSQAADTFQGAPHERVGASKESNRPFALAGHVDVGGQQDGVGVGIVAGHVLQAMAPGWRQRDRKDGSAAEPWTCPPSK